jgi:hypothetical protein
MVILYVNIHLLWQYQCDLCFLHAGILREASFCSVLGICTCIWISITVFFRRRKLFLYLAVSGMHIAVLDHLTHFRTHFHPADVLGVRGQRVKFAHRIRNDVRQSDRLFSDNGLVNRSTSKLRSKNETICQLSDSASCVKGLFLN